MYVVLSPSLIFFLHVFTYYTAFAEYIVVYVPLEITIGSITANGCITLYTDKGWAEFFNFFIW